MKTTGEAVTTSVGFFYIALALVASVLVLSYAKKIWFFGTIPQLPRQRGER
jgi:hypothetical protein